MFTITFAMWSEIRYKLQTIIPLIRVPDLKAMLKAGDEVALVQRLGYVLEIARKAELVDVVEGWLPPRLDLIPLSSSTPKSKAGQVVQRWRILNNAPGVAIDATHTPGCP